MVTHSGYANVQADRKHRITIFMWFRSRKREPVRIFCEEEPIPKLELPARISGIQACRDMQILKLFEGKLGPLTGRHSAIASARRRGDYWLFDAMEFLGTFVTRHESTRQVDIRDVFGFTGSRDDLKRFSTIEEMHATLARSTPWAREEIERLMLQVIKSNEGRMWFNFVTHTGRLWCINSDGSHRMAAIITAARNLKLPIEVEGRVWKWRITSAVLDQFEERWGIWVVAPGQHLSRIRLSTELRERFALVEPPFDDQLWPPTLLVTERPAAALPPVLSAAVRELLDSGGAMPLRQFVLALLERETGVPL